MEEKETIVIDVQLSAKGVANQLAEVNEKIAEVKAQNASMRKEVKDGTKTWKEVSGQLAVNEQRLKTLSTTQKVLSNQFNAQVGTNKRLGDSLKEMGYELTALKNEYRSLSEAERNSAKGQDLLKHIQDLDAKMKGADASMGDFQRNVGDYANQIAKISGLFGSAGGAASGMAGKLGLVTKGFGALAATPLIAVLTGLVAIIQKATQAMKGSEAQTMRWKEIMAVFEPLLISVKNGLTAFAGVLINVVEGAIKGVTAAMEGLAKAADWVGRLFGADWGLTEKTQQLKEQAAAQVELTKAENDYIIQKRAWGVEAAEIDRDVANLRAKVAEKDKYTAKEREQYLQQALDLERKKAAEEKRLAEENLRILETRAAQTENDAAMNDKLAEARIAVINADTNLANTERNLQREMNRLHNEIRQEGVAAWNEYVAKVKEVRKQLGELIAELPTLEELQKKSDEQTKKQAENIAKAIEPLKEAEEEIKLIVDEVENVPDLSDKFKPSMLDQFAAAFERNAKTIESVSSSLQSSFGSLSQMYEQIANDETKSEEEREAAAKKAKRWSAIQIAANAGTAVAKGVASAVDVGFPAAIPAMAAMTAAILAAIAQAKALAAEGHEQGGVLGGRFIGATSGPDTMTFRGRPGELILNAQQQRELYDIANGEAKGGSTAAALAEALRNMPAPVMVYEEFSRFGQKIVNINELTKLQ